LSVWSRATTAELCPAPPLVEVSVVDVIEAGAKEADLTFRLCFCGFESDDETDGIEADVPTTASAPIARARSFVVRDIIASVVVESV
jgi:hypothetical protein